MKRSIKSVLLVLVAALVAACGTVSTSGDFTLESGETVRGDLVVTVNRVKEGAFDPEKGPVPKMSRFSGEKGATSGPTSSKRSLELIPLPPI